MILYLIIVILGRIRHAEFLKGKLGCPDERGGDFEQQQARILRNFDLSGVFFLGREYLCHLSSPGGKHMKRGSWQSLVDRWVQDHV